ncbi:uncharacterized protein LOC134277449 [Saccostrea cucullata]|uniref:uncharacterized protein LOC134277449 n=1 Tax=Saccostrea cuccullata TaxID=36930 RepID=UPI002ED1D960
MANCSVCRANLRTFKDDLRERCVTITGFPITTVEKNVTSLLPCQRAHQKRDGSAWIVLFSDSQEAHWWLKYMSPYNVGKITLMITDSDAIDIPEDWFKKENCGLGGAQVAVICNDAQFTEDEQQIEFSLYNDIILEKRTRKEGQ